MVGRLSIYAKNRILNLRFQKNNKIKHIAQTLLSEDNIKGNLKISTNTSKMNTKFY